MQICPRPPEILSKKPAFIGTLHTTRRSGFAAIAERKNSFPWSRTSIALCAASIAGGWVKLGTVAEVGECKISGLSPRQATISTSGKREAIRPMDCNFIPRMLRGRGEIAETSAARAELAVSRAAVSESMAEVSKYVANRLAKM